MEMRKCNRCNSTVDPNLTKCPTCGNNEFRIIQIVNESVTIDEKFVTKIDVGLKKYKDNIKRLENFARFYNNKPVIAKGFLDKIAELNGVITNLEFTKKVYSQGVPITKAETVTEEIVTEEIPEEETKAEEEKEAGEEQAEVLTVDKIKTKANSELQKGDDISSRLDRLEGIITHGFDENRGSHSASELRAYVIAGASIAMSFVIIIFF